MFILTFHILLANAVKILVGVIYPEIKTDLAHIRNRRFFGKMLLHPLKLRAIDNFLPTAL